MTVNSNKSFLIETVNANHHGDRKLWSSSLNNINQSVQDCIEGWSHHIVVHGHFENESILCWTKFHAVCNKESRTNQLQENGCTDRTLIADSHYWWIFIHVILQTIHALKTHEPTTITFQKMVTRMKKKTKKSLVTFCTYTMSWPSEVIIDKTLSSFFSDNF